jgi:hypothetical protein
MKLPPPKVCQRIRKLHAQIGSSGKDGDVAREKLNQLLAEHGLSWNDLPNLLAADLDDHDAGRAAAAPDASPPDADVPDDLLGLVMRLLEEHVAVTANERLAIALWIFHAWVFDRFTITPRLASLSPVRGCGKTTLLALIELLVPEGSRSDNTSAAAIYYALGFRPRTRKCRLRCATVAPTIGAYCSASPTISGMARPRALPPWPSPLVAPTKIQV